MTQGERMHITVLGTRGSVPVCGREFDDFGGNTSCYLVEAGNQSILLDAGSGLVNAPVAFARTPVILLSHLHVDHLLGLGMYQRLSQPGATTELFVPATDDVNAKAVLERLYSPPLWPLRLDEYPSELRIGAMRESMQFGDVTVETTTGSHPGGCLLIKICHAQRTLVYATDFEHGREASARLAEFSRDADLVLYDGQYDEAEYEPHRGFGHSTPNEGVALLERSNARRLLVVHHDPHSNDQELLARERALGNPDVRFAREGETIEL